MASESTNELEKKFLITYRFLTITLFFQMSEAKFRVQI